jgi:hypothetical protein
MTDPKLIDCPALQGGVEALSTRAITPWLQPFSEALDSILQLWEIVPCGLFPSPSAALH